MKSITEFSSFTLGQAFKAKTALTSEGKSPEEIQQNFAETYKYEGDKLKYFVNAVDIAGQNLEKLKRVVVMSLAEGEAAPPKATKVEEVHYLPEYYVEYKPAPKSDGKNRGPKRGGGDSKKSSPWGLSPEEKAAKKGKAAKPS